MTFLYSHSGSKNHGCEAIVRSTSKILNLKKTDCVLYSYNEDEDTMYGLDDIIKVEPFKSTKNCNLFKKNYCFFYGSNIKK